MIDYRLHVFRQVAEVRSLTKASKALHLSQPAVSKHIKLLEEELRVPLFVRSSTGVVLTDAGTIFLRHVQETEKSRAAVMEKLQAPVGLLTGTLRLGSSMTIASYYLPDVLVRFKAKHAAVKCEVVEGNTDLILGLLPTNGSNWGSWKVPVAGAKSGSAHFIRTRLFGLQPLLIPWLRSKIPAPKRCWNVRSFLANWVRVRVG
jgi:molybdenum-dependent DNA-binding transcriptional regulator ModE